MNNHDVLREQQVSVREEDVVPEENGDVVPETFSAASRKLDMEPYADNEDEENEIHQSHYIIIDSSILELLISVIGVCPDCQSTEIKMYNVSNKKGLPNCIAITCSECNFSYSTYSSKEVNKPNTPGKKPFDVNASV